MFKKLLPAKFITAISFAVAIIGLIAEYAPVEQDSILFLVKIYGNSANVYNHILIGEPGRNWVNYALYISLLFGAIFYVVSRQREKRLIRFVFSVIFCSHLFAALFWVIRLPFYKNELGAPLILVIIDIVIYAALLLAWLYISWLVVNSLSQRTELATETNTYGDDVYVNYINATSWQRVFHVLIDIALSTFIIFNCVDYLRVFYPFKNFVFLIQSIVGERITLFLLVLIARTIYFFVTEWVFNASPAKLLAENRILTEDGEAPSAGMIFKRTLCRFIPFEAFSFFAPPGLHDRLSGTTVVKEKRTGVKGETYFLLPVGLALAGALIWGSMLTYKGNKVKEAENAQYDKLRNEYEKQLSHINTNSFIELQNGYSSSVTFLKVEKVEKVDKERVHVAVISTSENGSIQQLIENTYAKNKERLERITVKLSTLREAFRQRGNADDDGKRGIYVNGTKYYPVSIQEFYGMNLQLDYRGSYGNNSFMVYLKNAGWAAEVLEIKPLSANTAVDPIEKKFLPAYEINDNSLVIQGSSKADDHKFLVQITLKDTTGRKQIYHLSGSTTVGENSLVRIR